MRQPTKRVDRALIATDWIKKGEGTTALMELRLGSTAEWLIKILQQIDTLKTPQYSDVARSMAGQKLLEELNKAIPGKEGWLKQALLNDHQRLDEQRNTRMAPNREHRMMAIMLADKLNKLPVGDRFKLAQTDPELCIAMAAIPEVIGGWNRDQVYLMCYPDERAEFEAHEADKKAVEFTIHNLHAAREEAAALVDEQAVRQFEQIQESIVAATEQQ